MEQISTRRGALGGEGEQRTGGCCVRAVAEAIQSPNQNLTEPHSKTGPQNPLGVLSINEKFVMLLVIADRWTSYKFLVY